MTERKVPVADREGLKVIIEFEVPETPLATTPAQRLLPGAPGEPEKGEPKMTDVVLGDTCDRKLTNANAKSSLSDRQRRFLDAYRERLAIAPAARLAGVHRASVYRWLTDAEFADAMTSAADDYFRRIRDKVQVQEDARRRWREEREKARRPMRCHHLAMARAAKGR